MWYLIVLVPGNCLSIYFPRQNICRSFKVYIKSKFPCIDDTQHTWDRVVHSVYRACRL